ncbi:MAG: immunoglobulin domain-containing protein, partial [Verrucomicrobiia bacterium]
VNVPVTVSVAPVSQTALVGSNVTFSVTASGTGLSYQWLFGASVVGSGSSLALNNVTTSQAGLYTVIVSGAGTPVTNSATLTVNVPVTATPLSSMVVYQGESAAFNTVASGTGPLNYVWMKNSSVISGQAGNTLTLDNVTTNDTATYSVIVAGACGSVTNSANLTVDPASSPTLSIVNMRNGTVNVSAANGAPGQSFVLLVSTNLVNWTIVSTNTADSTGASTFVGLDATNHLHYFYRTVTP